MASGVESKQNCTAKTTNLKKKMPEKSSRLLPSEQPCEPTSLDIAGVERIRSDLRAVTVNTRGNLILVLNERNVGDGANLCPLWLVILKSV